MMIFGDDDPLSSTKFLVEFLEKPTGIKSVCLVREGSQYPRSLVAHSLQFKSPKEIATAFP